MAQIASPDVLGKRDGVAPALPKRIELASSIVRHDHDPPRAVPILGGKPLALARIELPSRTLKDQSAVDRIGGPFQSN